MNLNTCLLAVSLPFLAESGCDDIPHAPDNKVPVFNVPKQQVEGARFKVERHGKFKAGYEDNEREILVITDNTTGRQYIGVTGVGVSELRREKSGDDTVTKER